MQVHLPWIVIFCKFEIFHNHFSQPGLKENLTQIMDYGKREKGALIISCRACLLIVFWWQKNKFYFLSAFDYWILLICLAMVQNEEKMHTKTVTDVSRGEEFWKLFCLEEMGDK